MATVTHAQAESKHAQTNGTPAPSNVLQRACACGQHSVAGGACEACRTRGMAALPAGIPLHEPEADSLSHAADLRHGADFSRVRAHSTGGRIQPKLTISQPGDAHEREADRVADAVMRMPDASMPDDGLSLRPSTKPEVQVQRQADGEHGKDDDDEEVIRLKAAPSETPAVTPELAARLDAARGGGAPLHPGARGFFEPRFGHDFSQVRVHNDPEAGRLSQALHAEAFAHGSHIFFAPGRFQPQTPAGRQLLAHELTHVVQQGGQQAPAGIRRKEVNASIMDTARKPLPPQDWYLLHREDWEHVSATGTEQGLGPNNSFMRAAWYNTLHVLPGEYHTVTERHDYYDLISYVIEHDPGTPKDARDVRFFHATTAVTGSPGIGSVDKPIGAIKLGAETRQILRDVNAELFALNMGVIRNLLSTWKEPRDPQTPSGRINAFDFDIRMVETEQGIVENFITQNKARFTPSVVQDINATMDPSAFGQYFNFSKRSFEWAIKALGVPTLDFTIRNHRQAIGFASVHIFHRKSEQDYLAFMKPRVPSVQSPNQYIVGNLNGVTLNDGLPGPLLTYDLPTGTLVEVIDWSHMMGPYQIGDIYAGKVNVRVLNSTYKGKVGWTDFTNLR